jgi:hypothetical protein
MAAVQGQHGGNTSAASLRQLVIHTQFAASTSDGFSRSSVSHSNYVCVVSSVVDPDSDPDQVRSASFCRIWIGINSKHMYVFTFLLKISIPYAV